MTKKQKEEIEKYFEEFNNLQNTLTFSFESDGKTILAQGYTEEGGDYPFEYDTDDTIRNVYDLEYSIEKDGVEKYLYEMLDDIYEHFDTDEEIRIWANVEESRRYGMSIRQLCHDIEEFDNSLRDANHKINDFLLAKMEEKAKKNKKSKETKEI